MKPTRLTLCLSVLLSLAGTLAAGERVVVLKNGSVIHGKVEQMANEIVVHTKSATLSLTPEEVYLVSDDLASVYEHKAAMTSAMGLEAHERFVLWCLRAGMRAEAHHQLASLRQRAPQYPRLRLLSNLVRSHRADRNTTTLPTTSPIPGDTQFAQDHLAQLSKSTVGDFVRYVQPLMLNRCGQANCHGRATSTSFALVGSPRSGAPARLTHRNLGATLQRLAAPAAQTMLWMSANAPHGPLKRKPLQDAELLRLFRWVERACDELGQNRDVGVSQASAERPLDEGGDPFDPAEFNSQTRIDGTKAEAEGPSEAE